MRRIANSWPTAATSWGPSWPAAAPAAPRRPRTRPRSRFNKNSFEQYGDRPEYRTRLARYRNNLGDAPERCGAPHDAEKTFRATLELLSSSIEGPEALPGARWQFARASNNLGALLLFQRRDGAGQPLRRAREILMKLAAEFPAVAQYSQELALIDYNLGLMAQSAGHAA